MTLESTRPSDASSRRARRAFALLGLCAALAAIAAWYYLREDGSHLEQARLAIERNDYREMERLAGVLRRQGRLEHAQFLQASVFFEEARRQQDLADRQARYDIAERLLRFAGDRGAELFLPGALAPQAFLHDPGTTAFVARHRPLLPKLVETKHRADQFFRRAQVELEAIPRDSTVYLEAAPLLGECRLERGDLKGAVECFRFVVERQPDQSDARRFLAERHYELGNVELAAEHARALAELEPDDGYPHRLLAVMARNHRRFAEARKEYRAALDRQLELGLRVRVLKEFAEMLVEDVGDCDAALRVLDRTPEAHAHDPELAVLRAECLWSQGKRDDARALADSALRGNPDLFAGLLLRGRMHLEEEQPREALPLLKRAVVLTPHDFRGREQLARAYRQLGEADRAAEQDQRRQELVEIRTRLTVLSKKAVDHPWDADCRLEIAALYVKLDRPAEARQWLKAALACDPDHVEARNLLRRLEGIPR